MPPPECADASPGRAAPPGRSAPRSLVLAAGALAGLLSFAAAIPGTAMRRGARGFAVHDDQIDLISNLRYFVWDHWRWPLTRAAGLGSARGAIVAFNDAIPLYALALRIVRRAITPDFDFVGWWLLLAFAAQGAAAAAAVRMWGGRRIAPCAAAAVLAVSLASWLAQTVHPALMFTAPVFLAVGLCGASRAISPRRRASAWLALGWIALGVNAYIFAMIVPLAVASLAFPDEKAERRRGVATLAILFLGAAAELGALGLLTPHAPGRGFSFHSMNLLSPIDPPAGSLLGRAGHPIDATGGQYEGMNYLGPGVIAVVLAALVLRRREVAAFARRRAPVLVAAAALTALALSNRVFLGRRLVLLFPPPPAFLGDLRAPGRLFWPVADLLLVVGVAAVARRGRRFDLLLLAAAALQWADAAASRSRVRATLEDPPPPLVDPRRWEPLVAAHRRVLFIPGWSCARGEERRFVAEAVLAASASRTEVSSVRNGRPDAVDCGLEESEARRAEPEAGTLVVTLGEAAGPPLSLRWRCARFRQGRACSANPAAFPALAAVGTIETAGRGRAPRVPATIHEN